MFEEHEEKKEHKRHVDPSGLTPEQLKEIQKSHGKPEGSQGIKPKEVAHV